MLKNVNSYYLANKPLPLRMHRSRSTATLIETLFKNSYSTDQRINILNTVLIKGRAKDPLRAKRINRSCGECVSNDRQVDTSAIYSAPVLLA